MPSDPGYSLKMRFPALLWIIVALFVGLAATYASITPYRMAGELRLQRGPDGSRARVADIGAPDERQHANYIARLARGEGLPTFNPNDSNLYEHYQFHQPPLFYAIGALASKVLAADPEDASGSRVRWLNILFGVGTIIGIFLIGRWGLGSDAVGLGGAAIAALMPMFLSLHGAISNDPLLILGFTAVLSIAAHAIRFGWTWRTTILLGVVTGLALWTKTSAAALLPTLMVLAFVTPCRTAPLMMRISPLVIALMLIAPWWVRNTQLYGDPLAMQAFREAFVGSAQRENLVMMIAATRQNDGLDPSGASLEYWTQWFGWWTLRSFYGAFSQMDIFFSDTVYRLLAVPTALLSAGWVLSLRAQQGEEPEDLLKRRAMTWVLGTVLVVVVLLFLQFNLTYFQAQARYLYPASAAIFLGLAGLLRRLDPLKAQRVIVAYVGLALVLNLIAIGYVKMGFAERMGL